MRQFFTKMRDEGGHCQFVFAICNEHIWHGTVTHILNWIDSILDLWRASMSMQEYLVDMKNEAAKAGKIGTTGCPELPF